MHTRGVDGHRPRDCQAEEIALVRPWSVREAIDVVVGWMRDTQEVRLDHYADALMCAVRERMRGELDRSLADVAQMLSEPELDGLPSHGYRIGSGLMRRLRK